MSTPIEHIDIALGERHAPHNWEYADATAREAATGFVPADVGKQALQLDDFSRWTLTDDDPATWQSDTASGSPGLHAASHENGGSDEIDVGGLSGVLADPQVADKIVETSGPTTLDIGDIVDGEFLKRVGTEIVSDTPGAAGTPFELVVACSDEATSITTGTAKITFYFPVAVNITGVSAGLTGQSSSGAVTIDVNKNGTTIFSTNLTIDASEDTSHTAVTPAALSSNPTAFAVTDKVTIDIDGAGTSAEGLKVSFTGTRQ